MSRGRNKKSRHIGYPHTGDADSPMSWSPVLYGVGFEPAIVLYMAAPVEPLYPYPYPYPSSIPMPSTVPAPAPVVVAGGASDAEIVGEVCRRLLEGGVGDGLRSLLRLALDRAERA